MPWCWEFTVCLGAFPNMNCLDSLLSCRGPQFRFRQHSRRLQTPGRADKARFLNIAQASLEEGRYYLILARDLEYSTATSPPCLLRLPRIPSLKPVQHSVNDDPRHTHIHPHRKRPLGDGAMSLHVHTQAAAV